MLLPKTVESELKNYFYLLDQDRNGYLGLDQLLAILKKCELDAADAVPIILFAFKKFGVDNRLLLTSFMAACVYLHGI